MHLWHEQWLQPGARRRQARTQALRAVDYSVLNGSEQLFASHYKLVLPSEEALRRELDRERASLMGQVEVDSSADGEE